MRVISYNILDGGVGRGDPLAEIIEAQRADIVALVEADNPDVLERIGRRLDMDHIQATGTAGHSVALLCRWPIVETVNHALLRPSPPCLLEALIAEPGGPQWTVGVAHCRPYATEAAEAERQQQVAWLLNTFAEHRRQRRPHLLVGDFNANAPIQVIDPAQCTAKTRQAFEQNGGEIPRRAVQMVLDAGYIDSLHAAAGEAAARMYTFTTQFPGQRVDYAFTWGIQPGRLRQAWIEHDRLARYASDHYPIGLEIAA